MTGYEPGICRGSNPPYHLHHNHCPTMTLLILTFVETDDQTLVVAIHSCTNALRNDFGAKSYLIRLVTFVYVGTQKMGW